MIMCSFHSKEHRKKVCLSALNPSNFTVFCYTFRFRKSLALATHCICFTVLYKVNSPKIFPILTPERTYFYITLQKMQWCQILSAVSGGQTSTLEKKKKNPYSIEKELDSQLSVPLCHASFTRWGESQYHGVMRLISPAYSSLTTLRCIDHIRRGIRLPPN